MSIEQEIRDYEALNADTAMQLNKAKQRIAELESQLEKKQAILDQCFEQRDTAEAQLAEAREEAKALAVSLWIKHHRKDSPEFELCDSVAGIISQINNMVAGIIDKLEELEAQLAHKEELRQEALGCLKNATSRADKLQAQLDECVDYLKDGETIAECIQRNRDDASSTLTLLAKEKRKSEELQAQLDEVVLVTCAKHSPRTINEIGCPYCQTEQAEAQLAEYNKQIQHLLRFVPPQNHDPLCRLHNDAVDYLLESIKGEDS